MIYSDTCCPYEKENVHPMNSGALFHQTYTTLIVQSTQKNALQTQHKQLTLTKTIIVSLSTVPTITNYGFSLHKALIF